MTDNITQAAKDQLKSLSARFEDSIFGQSIAGANKTFLAGIGAAEQARTGFEAKFNEWVADGETARKEVKKAAEKWRDQAAKDAKSARLDAKKRVEAAIEKALAFSPIATSSDVNKLSAKLDKVLATVAK